MIVAARCARHVQSFSRPLALRFRCKPWPSRSQHSIAGQQNDKPYYVTTPIFYVNASPHVGHLYSMVIADVLKRWNELSGRKSVLCTGTDEHGMKVLRAAQKARVEPSEFCQRGSEVFKSLAAEANISNTHFIRTTDAKHKEAVQHAWTILLQKGYIYLSKHEGWYSVSDETFYPQSGVHLIVDPPTGRKMMVSIETGKEVEWTSETNYRFRLSAFQEPLLRWYEENPESILPASRGDEIKKAVASGLQDLSVSRPSLRLSWGVPVPGDDSQTIYVWLDALMNYASVTGYPWTPGHENETGWPADVHVIGKDIMRFHCIYWPAFLMALDLPLPKQVLSHGHWTLGNEKMAKSTGNVVDPFLAIERFGIDVVRFFLMFDSSLTQDADYGNEKIGERYKKWLQGGIGNLMSRTVRGKKWSVREAVKRVTSGEVKIEEDEESQKHVEILKGNVIGSCNLMANSNPMGAIKQIVGLARATNNFLAVKEPWAVADAATRDPTAKDDLDRAIFIAAETLRLTAILMQPFIPEKSSRMFEMLGVSENRRMLDDAVIGKDAEYGTPQVELGSGLQNVLFPPLLGVR